VRYHVCVCLGGKGVFSDFKFSTPSLFTLFFFFFYGIMFYIKVIDMQISNGCSIEFLSRNALCAPNLISTFYYYHWVDTSADGLLISEDIIRPVVSVSALTWFIIICYWNLQFLNNEIIIKTKVLLQQAEALNVQIPILSKLVFPKIGTWTPSFSILHKRYNRQLV
jgi:uncharacterized membrane protein YwzB